MSEDFRRLDRELDRLRKKIKGLEDYKVASEVFDKSTLMTLYYLANKGFIDILNGVIKTGKEANVFFGEGRRGEELAVKIHRVTTGDYRAFLRYIEGDPRFRGIKKSRRRVIYTWVRKEYINLKRAREADVRVPKALAYRNNILIMEFIGENGVPAPMLKDWDMERPGDMLEEVLKQAERLYRKAHLIHADLSEYNILVHRGKPVIIDLSQAVVKEHPSGDRFLRRDVVNLVKFFKDYVDIGNKEVYGRITGGRKWNM
jgi:RIO kinase 1